MDWQSVSQSVFAFMGLAIAGWVARSLDKMRESVEQLNVKMAVIVERTDNHEKRLERLEGNKEAR